MAVGRVEDAERAATERIRDLETRLLYANRSIDAWHEHAERHARPPTVAPQVESYDLRPRPLPTASRYTDPYAPEAKCIRYEYDEREPEGYQRVYAPRHSTPSGAGPSTPPAPPVTAPNPTPRDPYADDPYASGTRYYRS